MSSTSEDDSKIFSPRKPYRWLYALWALQSSLRKALSQVQAPAQNHRAAQLPTKSEQGELEDVFLARGIQLLRDALLQPQLLEISLASPVQYQVAETMIDTLLHFLRGQSDYAFSNSARRPY